MPKLLPNRVSKALDPALMDNIQNAAEAFTRALGEPTPINDDELKKLQKVAETRKRIADDVFRVLEQHPASLNAPLSLEEIRKDKALYEMGLTLEALLVGLLFNVRREMSVAGAEYQNAMAIFEEDIKTDVNRNVAEARIVQAKLDAIERNKAGRKNNPPPPAG